MHYPRSAEAEIANIEHMEGEAFSNYGRKYWTLMVEMCNCFYDRAKRNAEEGIAAQPKPESLNAAITEFEKVIGELACSEAKLLIEFLIDECNKAIMQGWKDAQQLPAD